MPNYEILPLSAECFGQFQLVIMAVLCTECIQRSSPSGHRDGAQFAYWDEWSVKRRVAFEICCSHCECKVDIHGVFMGALRTQYICWSYHNAIRSFLCFAAEAITHRRDTWLHSDCHTHTHIHMHPHTHTHTLVLKYLTSTWNAIEMRLLTHSTRARNSIWIFSVISEVCRGRGMG